MRACPAKGKIGFVNISSNSWINKIAAVGKYSDNKLSTAVGSNVKEKKEKVIIYFVFCTVVIVTVKMIEPSTYPFKKKINMINVKNDGNIPKILNNIYTY